MSRLRVNAFGISIDGYGAGPDQALENPMGVGGMPLQQWVLGTKTLQKMAADFAGPAVKIGLNPDYLAQFLAAVETDQVLLELKDENSQCIARPLGGEELAYEYVYIVMQMRIG